MKMLAAIGKELVGLFVDDEGLAFAVLGVVAAGLGLAFGVHAPSGVTGAAHVLGCLGALVVSVLRGRA